MTKIQLEDLLLKILNDKTKSKEEDLSRVLHALISFIDIRSIYELVDQIGRKEQLIP